MLNKIKSKNINLSPKKNFLWAWQRIFLPVLEPCGVLIDAARCLCAIGIVAETTEGAAARGAVENLKS